MGSYEKNRIALRYWLLGAGYIKAAEAMVFAETYHCGTRKDGVTPEFAHQVAIASYLRTLAPHLINAEAVLTTSFLHDVREDYNVAYDIITDGFGSEVSNSVDAMTKEFQGSRRAPEAVFGAIAADPHASVAKGADRIHNLQTMIGVFSPAKVQEYIAETEQWFLPMLKAARRRFPAQEPAYENIKLVLVSQIELLRAAYPSA